MAKVTLLRRFLHFKKKFNLWVSHPFNMNTVLTVRLLPSDLFWVKSIKPEHLSEVCATPHIRSAVRTCTRHVLKEHVSAVTVQVTIRLTEQHIKTC